MLALSEAQWKVLATAAGYGFVLPAVVAALIAALAQFRPNSLLVGRAVGAAAIALGWLAAVAGLQLAPLTPDAELAWRWLPTLVVLAAGCGCLPEHLRLGAGFLVAALAGWLLIPSWDSFQASRGVLGLGIGAVILALGGLLPQLAREPRWAAGGMVLAALAAALILERSRTGLFTQMAGALAGALLGFMIVANRPAIVSGAIPVVAVLLPGLLASGRFNSHSDVPTLSYVFCALATLGLAIQGNRWLRLGVTGLLAGSAVAVAYWAEPAASLLFASDPVTSPSGPVR